MTLGFLCVCFFLWFGAFSRNLRLGFCVLSRLRFLRTRASISGPQKRGIVNHSFELALRHPAYGLWRGNAACFSDRFFFGGCSAYLRIFSTSGVWIFWIFLRASRLFLISTPYMEQFCDELALGFLCVFFFCVRGPFAISCVWFWGFHFPTPPALPFLSFVSWSSGWPSRALLPLFSFAMTSERCRTVQPARPCFSRSFCQFFFFFFRPGRLPLCLSVFFFFLSLSLAFAVSRDFGKRVKRAWICWKGSRLNFSWW